MNTKEEIIKKIKEKGYWEINIRPDSYKAQRIDKRLLRDIVRTCKVGMSGWDYPPFADRDGEPYPILNGIEKSVSWENYIEFWRMTTSANFYHLVALREDWCGDVEYHNVWAQGDELKGKKWLGVFRTLYTFTEIFEFAKRLASKDIFDEIIVIDIKLHDLKNRMLVVDDRHKVPFSYPRVAQITEAWSYSKKSFSAIDLLSKRDELALDQFLHLVYIFQWENPPVDTLKNEQQKFLQGKI